MPKTELTEIRMSNGTDNFNVIAVFNNGDKKYVAYTNGIMVDNCYDIKVSRYEVFENEIKLYDLHTQEELDFVDNYMLNEVLGGKENENN